MFSATTTRNVIVVSSSTVTALILGFWFWKSRRSPHAKCQRREKPEPESVSADPSGAPAPTRLCLDLKRIWIVETVAQWDALWPMLEREIRKVKVLSLDCEWKNWKERGRVSLLQLSTSSGLVILVRLLLLESIPDTLIQMLEDDSIIKVGVQIQDDVKKLYKDHDIFVDGWMDLRNLALQENLITSIRGKGLAGLSKLLLEVELDKSSRVPTSDWEAPALSQKQVEYAAADALVGSFIFNHIAALRLCSLYSHNEVYDLCSALINVNVSKNQAADQSSHGFKENSPASNMVVKPRNRAYIPRKTPMYQNCRLLAPDNQLLSTCDEKKAQWYVDKGLADKVGDKPLTVKLRFEPSGRPKSEANYYCQAKRNICVVCGAGEAYVRKNIVPHEYRKFFPSVMKEHRSHDVLLLCLACHQQSNLHDLAVKRRLEQDCDAEITTKYNSDFQLKQVISAAKALQQHSDRLPASRKQELEEMVTNYYGVDHMDGELLQRALTINAKLPNADYTPHGQKVVQFMIKSAGLVEFEKMWRQHFVETMRPQHLPEMWSIEYQAKDVQELDSQLLSYIHDKPEVECTA